MISEHYWLEYFAESYKPDLINMHSFPSRNRMTYGAVGRSSFLFLIGSDMVMFTEGIEL